jgi:hypothetical protein
MRACVSRTRAFVSVLRELSVDVSANRWGLALECPYRDSKNYWTEESYVIRDNESNKAGRQISRQRIIVLE